MITIQLDNVDMKMKIKINTRNIYIAMTGFHYPSSYGSHITISLK